MNKKQYLFLCHHGAKRSPTAASVAREIAEARGLDIEMNYGAADAIHSGNAEYMTKHLARYEKIIVMQKDIAKKLGGLGIEKSRIFCLNIGDNYERQDEQLRKILREKLDDLIKDSK